MCFPLTAFDNALWLELQWWKGDSFAGSCKMEWLILGFKNIFINHILNSDCLIFQVAVKLNKVFQMKFPL